MTWHLPAAAFLALLSGGLAWNFAPVELRTEVVAGVLAGGLSCLLAIWWKGWAVRRSTQAALGIVVASFFARLVTLGGGALVVAFSSGKTLAFVAGFIAVYLPLQAIEMAYVIAVQKQLRAKVESR